MKVDQTVLVSNLLLASAGSTLAFPVATAGSSNSIKRAPQSHAITRCAPTRSDPDKLVKWSKSHCDRLQRKYGLNGHNKKAKRDGSESLINLEYDSTWLADIDVGTPAKTYAVVLDTGSADFWLASTSFDPSSSSTFSNSSTTFDLTYGSGDVAGYLGTDTVTLAGTTGTGVVLAVADEVSSDLADEHIAGIMGMGFKALSRAGAGPFWKQMDVDTFSFYLERRNTISNAKGDEAEGGIFTLGGTNTSLYQGNINYISLIEEEYWMIKLDGISTAGTGASLGSLYRAAIDTGTTLIGGPDDVIETLYSQIPESSAIASSPGYYSYPCSNPVNATITFGGVEYTIPDTDFSAGALDPSGTLCMGALFGTGSTSKDDLQWIVGDAFLENVYSVFTMANGSGQVGFASLASGLNSGTTSDTVVVTWAPSASTQTSGASLLRPATGMLFLAAL